MSVRAMSYVWQHSRQKGATLLLLLAIADAADEHGENAWPSVATLAKKIRMSPRTVQMLTGTLVASGELRVEAQAGRHGTHRYAVVMTDGEPVTPKQPGRPRKTHAARGESASEPPQTLHPISPEQGCNIDARGAKYDVPGVQKSPQRGAAAIAPDPSVNPSTDPSVNPSTDPSINPSFRRTRIGQSENRSVPKPAALDAAERAVCPVHAAMVEVAGGEPLSSAEMETWDKVRGEAIARALAAGQDREALAEEYRERGARYRRIWPHLAFSAVAVWRHWTTLRANAAEPGVSARSNAEVAAQDEARARQQAEAAAELAAHEALLAELGTDSRTQVWWGETTRQRPPLRDCWRAAIFVPPETADGAALVFRQAADRDEAAQSAGQYREVSQRVVGRYGVLGQRVALVTVAEWRASGGGS